MLHAFDSTSFSPQEHVSLTNAHPQVRIYNLETGVELTGLTIEEKCSITSMFISQDQRHLLLNLAQQRIHLHELGDPATNNPSPTATAGPVQKYMGSQEQKGRFVVRSCLGGMNQAFVLSGSEDCKVCLSLLCPVQGGW